MIHHSSQEGEIMKLLRNFPARLLIAGAVMAALLLLCGLTASAQTKYTSTANGNWSTMTWSPVGTPGASDTVVIADNDTVSINTAVTITSLIVGGGTSGQLKFDGAATRQVVISGDLTVNSGASLYGRLNNQPGQDTLRLAGDLTNNGTFDLFPGGNTAALSNTAVTCIVFTKVGDQNIQTTGTPVLTRLGRVAFNKGSNTNRVVASINVSIGIGQHFVTGGLNNVVASLFLSGVTNGITQKGKWEQTAGTFNALTS